MTRSWRIRILGALLSLVLVAAGCYLVGGRTRAVHWDLRNSHRGADLGVKLNPHSGHDFEDLGPLDIDLPGGQRFHADKMSLVVAATHDDAENIDELICWYPEMSLDEAYRKAMELTRQFGLKSDGIVDFRQTVLDDLAKGDRQHLDGQDGGSDFPLLTPAGPLFGVGLKYATVNSGQPVTLKVNIAWGDNLRLTLQDQATASATPTAP
ncbi:hypothetical protein [Streptomyces sp. 1331.2]|uniref:hypothetical protein n=1 Tax=Streptomyces sp. 1331.2 TaxID=1938835 RepID=UPI000BC7A535|nr:hypothetical protein [Streptomyces sp. 1331.2]SOB82473.1 hypothetical protein SAMN06272789_2642 [Streptomyces sp. 1331.2]